MPTRTPDIKVKPGQVWALKHSSQKREVRVVQILSDRYVIVEQVLTYRQSRIQHDHRGLQGYRLVSEPTEES